MNFLAFAAKTYVLYISDFSWDESCGIGSFTSLWYYPLYEENTCNAKALSEFDKYDTEKYSTKVRK